MLLDICQFCKVSLNKYHYCNNFPEEVLIYVSVSYNLANVSMIGYHVTHVFL